jgi:hypothetical protein
MKNIDHTLKLVRSASLTLNVVRLCGFNKFGLRHPEPTGTASKGTKPPAANMLVADYLRVAAKKA